MPTHTAEINAGVLKVITDYLASVGKIVDTEPSLPGLIGYVDYKERCIPTLEEVAAGLSKAGGVHLIKRGDTIFFGPAPASGDEIEVRSLSREDMKSAYSQYDQWFTETAGKSPKRRKKSQ